MEGRDDLGTDILYFRQAVEKTETNIQWLKNNKEVIMSWLHRSKETEEIKVKDIRLPTHLVPDSYDITINPDIYGAHPGLFESNGHIKIHMRAVVAAKNVTLNAKSMNISEISIRFGTLDGSPGPEYNGRCKA